MVEEYTEESWPKDRWPNFSYQELKCSQTGLCRLDDDMMDALQGVRSSMDSTLIITSGYRHPTHSIEMAKDKPGTHTHGVAVDILINGGLAYELIEEAMKHDFPRIGVSQSGPHERRFIHLDMMQQEGWLSPYIWSYK